MCPSAATRTSPIRSSGGVDLTRNPDAPARSARSTYWSASNVVSTSTNGPVRELTDPLDRGQPSTPGMRRSMSTTSGRLRRTASTPAAPTWASSTTSMSSADPGMVRRCANHRLVVDQHDPDRRSHHPLRCRHVSGQRSFQAETAVRRRACVQRALDKRSGATRRARSSRLPSRSCLS